MTSLPQTACEQFLGKSESEIQHIALVTLEGHQRAIMGSMTVEEIYKDRKKFSKQVFEVASSDLVNMGITVVSYTLKDIRDEEVSAAIPQVNNFSFFFFSPCQNLILFPLESLDFLLRRIITATEICPGDGCGANRRTIFVNSFSFRFNNYPFNPLIYC